MSWRTVRKRATASLRRRTTTIRGSFTPCRTRRWWCMHRGMSPCWDRCTICRCWRWWEPATPPNMGAGWRRICPMIWRRLDLSSSADWRWASIPTPIPARCVPGSGRLPFWVRAWIPTTRRRAPRCANRFWRPAAWCSPNWSRLFRCGERTFPPATACWQD